MSSIILEKPLNQLLNRLEAEVHHTIDKLQGAEDSLEVQKVDDKPQTIQQLLLRKEGTS